MKKGLIALLVAACLLLPCAFAEQAVEYEPLLFTLWGDNSEGYEWSCDYEDNGVLEAPFVEYMETENGVCYEYNFGVRAPGRAQIVFNYGANFALSMPERTMICTVIADESGACTVRRAERYSQDRILVVNLPSNPTTGVNWNYEEDPSGMVTLVSEEYTPLDEYLEGAGAFFCGGAPPAPGRIFSNLWDCIDKRSRIAYNLEDRGMKGRAARAGAHEGASYGEGKGRAEQDHRHAAARGARLSGALRFGRAEAE